MSGVIEEIEAWCRHSHSLTVSVQDGEREEQEHEARALAANPQPKGYTYSHQTALVLHGLPVLGKPGLSFHITRVHGTAPTTGIKGKLHRAHLSQEETASLGGLQVTSVARTLCDIAIDSGIVTAVCAIDAALRKGCITAEEMLASIHRLRHRKNSRNIRLAWALADGRSKGVGESIIRMIIHDSPGIPRPDLESEIVGDSGQVLGVASFVWPNNVIGVFDGYAPYETFLRPGLSMADAVREQRERDDLLRSHGFLLMRWTWVDLKYPLVFRNKLQHILADRSCIRPAKTLDHIGQRGLPETSSFGELCPQAAGVPERRLQPVGIDNYLEPSV